MYKICSPPSLSRDKETTLSGFKVANKKVVGKKDFVGSKLYKRQGIPYDRPSRFNKDGRLKVRKRCKRAKKTTGSPMRRKKTTPGISLRVTPGGGRHMIFTD